MTAEQLKNSILQYAVQGKLVEQNPADEPASELLKRIRIEKEQLIKEKKIRKEKPLPHITEEEIPFDIPESWEWVRLGEITLINPRNKIDDKLEVSFIPMRLIEDGYGSAHTSEKRKWTAIKSGFTHFKENDIAVAKITPSFENRKSALLTNLTNGYGAGTTEIHILRTFSNTISRKYLLFFVKTEMFIRNGVKAFRGTAGQQRIGKEYVSEALFPLPPLAEQERIVAKIEELMPLVEEYGKAEQELNELNSRFPEQIRKSVLQYAIEGKLTAQNPADEPASELLKRIRKEKEQLIKEKKIRKEKPLPPISEEEIPFEIPKSWEWVRLGEIITLNSGQDLSKSQYSEINKTGIPYITGASNIQNDNLIINRWTQSPRSIAIKGDLLLTCKGTVGKMILLEEDSVHIARQLMSIKHFIISSKFLRIVLESQIEQFKKQANSFIPGIDRATVLNTYSPLPPLAEQERIVAKVEEVLGVCEGL